MREIGLDSLFFKEKFGKDPKDLTLEQIDAVAIKNSKECYRTSRCITTGNSVFKCKYYDIEKLFDKAIKR